MCVMLDLLHECCLKRVEGVRGLVEHLSNFPNALFCILTIMAHNNQTTEPSQRGNKQICISKSSWEKS